jgi:hypothetical protein
MRLNLDDDKNSASLLEPCGDLFSSTCNEWGWSVIPTRRHFSETLQPVFERLVFDVVYGSINSRVKLRQSLNFMTKAYLNDDRRSDSLLFQSRITFGQMIEEVMKKICDEDASQDRQFLSTLIRPHAYYIFQLLVVYIFEKGEHINLLFLANMLNERYNNRNRFEE